MASNKNKLGTCDRSGCSKTPTHYVRGYAWGVPLVCSTHAKDEPPWVQVQPLEKEDPE